jgi:hypothetical protein
MSPFIILIIVVLVVINGRSTNQGTDSWVDADAGNLFLLLDGSTLLVDQPVDEPSNRKCVAGIEEQYRMSHFNRSPQQDFHPR